MAEALDNRVLILAILGWFTAQFIKLFIDLYRTHKVNFRYLASSGGMPSAHSALVCSVATAVARLAGVQSPLFAVSAVFAAVVMYDAAGVRQAASAQARILNLIVEELFTHRAFSESRLRELLGHTPIEVFAGAVLGIALGFAGTM